MGAVAVKGATVRWTGAGVMPLDTIGAPSPRRRDVPALVVTELSGATVPNARVPSAASA
jgi:hypothetical protein